MDLRTKAEILANRSYIVVVRPDLSTDGDPVFLAFSPEIEGCIGQGTSPEMAIENLREARIDYIQSLIEDNIPVPEPQTYQTVTTSGFSATYISGSHASPDSWNLVENDSEDFATTQLIRA